MKLTCIIILMALIQVSAATFGQNLTLKKDRVSISKIFWEIRKQTGYDVLLKSNELNLTKRINASFDNVPVTRVLDELMRDTELEYEVKDKVIVITKKEKSFFQKVIDKFLNIDVKGKVVDDKTGNPIPGASIKVKGTSIRAVSDQDGNFVLKNVEENAVIEITYVGLKMLELSAKTELGTIRLVENIGGLQEVSIVSTGYQTLPKERATGSFTVIDSALINRAPTTNILERLDGVASSVQFQKNVKAPGYNGSQFSIRGRSTINGDADPLIVLDNFPFTGDPSSINPNDIETITLLKDAAAASIWGTRAGNGVVVITTKSGKFNQKTTISLNSNVTIGQKPRLFTQQQISVKDYIGIEQFLFDQGAYNSDITSGYAPLSPAVEIMLMNRSGQISTTRRDQMLDSLSQYDTRRELLDYYYRVPVNQQYNLNISGGSDVQKFFLSGGFDRNILTAASDNFQRFSINGQNTYKLWKGKGQLVSGLQFTSSNKEGGRGLPINYQRYPYMNFEDANGNALASPADLRLSYIAAQQGKGLLDWYYRPLDELGGWQNETTTSFRLNNNLTYRIFKPFKISLYHAYQRGVSDIENNREKDSYYTRDQINRITSISSGAVIRPIAVGDIAEFGNTTFTSNLGRVQFILDQTIGKVGILNGIAGAEVSDYHSNSKYFTLYGYNSQLGTNANSNIDFTRDYLLYNGTGSTRIGTGLSNSGSIDRYVSYYANLSYAYGDKYIVSASARKDESNIFGVKSNQKGVPLWSAGASWEISKEEFYKFDAVPYLRLRTTYGYNGNVDKSTSAYLTATPGLPPTNRYGAFWASIVNPPNPSLKWERVENINLALDMATKNRRISGSFELYRKHGKDLIGTAPISPQTGVVDFTGNTANLITKGIDITLNTINLDGNLKWSSNVLFTYVRDRVSNYLATPGSNLEVVQGSYATPLVGFPYDAIFAYKWAGLDNTGAPQVYFKDQISKDYATISNSLDRNALDFIGSGTPTYFGSILNQFSWKNIDLSFNIVYRAGYYQRRQSLRNIYAGNYLISDYEKRWQKAGEELITDVPSQIYPNIVNRETTYTYANVLVYKGDQVRLQDVRLNLRLDQFFKTYFRQLSVFAYGNNLGILWKSNKKGIDPDSPTIKPVRNLSFGLTAQF